MISDRLREVIFRELGIKSYPIEDDTLAAQIPGWDSLAHGRVLFAIEKAYGIRIKGLEAVRLKNIGDLERLVTEKTSGDEKRTG